MLESSQTMARPSRVMPIGAEVVEGGVSFRIWAPKHSRVQVKLLESGELFPLHKEEGGHFGGTKEGLAAGARYYFKLDDDDYNYPDLASRYQPEGSHGPSEVVDPSSYKWKDDGWRGIELPGQVIYELHVGCFTAEGTWRAAEAKLQHLADTGITAVEVMPVAEFDGEFGWGYDGVQWYAPTRLYGTPDDFRHFVDTAHRQGLAVLLDVVYNHFGPSGDYNAAFSDSFGSQRHPTDWGAAINYDGPGAQGVREYVANNAAYWIREFHLDGLRLDATQSIYDDSPRHILADAGEAARKAAGGRKIVIVAENETQEVRHVEAVEAGGFGLDGIWNDDFHHAARVAATGHADFYYSDYQGSPQELASATKHGFLYQGQYAAGAKRYRGTPTWSVEGWRFVNCLQNHDQVSNSALGQRLQQLTSPGRYRALTTLWLLGPATPMFFMGQEFAATTPFLFFADHQVELAKMVREGRWEMMRCFPRTAGYKDIAPQLPDPSDRGTFQMSKLDWRELDKNTYDVRLHRDLLRLRREDPVFSKQDRWAIETAVIGPECFVVRWHSSDHNDRLMLINLGRDYGWPAASEPIVAAPPGKRWQLIFSSDASSYGGSGTAVLNTRHWNIPGHAAIVLGPADLEEEASG